MTAMVCPFLARGTGDRDQSKHHVERQQHYAQKVLFFDGNTRFLDACFKLIDEGREKQHACLAVNLADAKVELQRHS